MNTDRFLTRVFDKQEKKMIYLGHPWSWDPPIIAEMNKTKDPDRFVPMMCTGLKDKNKKLIYAGDILRTPSKDDWDKINFAAYEIFFCDNDSCDDHIGFRMNRVHYHGSVCGGWVPNFNPKTTSRMEIIGNILEGEE